MKTLFNIFLSALIVLVLGGCAKTNDPQPPLPTPPDPVERTVLVYMAARNNLSGADTADLNEMTEVAKSGAFGNNRLLVFHALNGMAPMLLEINSSGRQVLKTYDEEQLAVLSAVSMRKVIDDMKQFAPANRYGLILWSHGTGWIQDGAEYDGRIGDRSFGADYDANYKTMNITTLQQVLSNHEFDYIYFDCCFMMGVEVAYQLRYCTDFLVGSVSELPTAGMPYDLSLPYLMLDEPDLVSAASATFNLYDAYPGSARTCTMSVVRTEKMDMLANAVRNFYLTHPMLPQSFVPQKFYANNCRYFDFKHYIHNLMPSAEADIEKLDGYMAEIDDALAEVVLYEAATPYLWQNKYDEVKIEHHCGLSTYLLRDAQTAFDDYTGVGNNRKLTNYWQLAWYEDVARYLFENLQQTNN